MKFRRRVGRQPRANESQREMNSHYGYPNPPYCRGQRQPEKIPYTSSNGPTCRNDGARHTCSSPAFGHLDRHHVSLIRGSRAA